MRAIKALKQILNRGGRKKKLGIVIMRGHAGLKSRESDVKTAERKRSPFAFISNNSPSLVY